MIIEINGKAVDVGEVAAVFVIEPHNASYRLRAFGLESFDKKHLKDGAQALLNSYMRTLDEGKTQIAEVLSEVDRILKDSQNGTT